MKSLSSVAVLLPLFLSILAANAAPLDQWHWRNPLPQGNSLSGVAYVNGTFVGVGHCGTILTSTDGTNWLLQSSGTQSPLAGVVSAGGTTVAVGGDYGGPVILTSSDTHNWTNRTPSGVYSAINGVGYGNGLFVAVGSSILTSTDGASWNVYGQIVPNYGTYNSVAYGHGVFVSVGDGGDAMTSVSPGTWWQAVNSGTGADLKSVVFANNLFVAAGSSGTILTSTDGTNWVSQVSGSTNNFYDATFGNGLYVVAGDGGAILTSADGTNWAAQSMGSGWNLRSMASGGGRFVAVGDAGVMVISTDGANWIHADSGLRNQVNGATYGLDLFVDVGDGGAIWTSPDGQVWTSRNSGTTNDLFCVASGADDFVAVGAGGAIVASRDGTNWQAEVSGTSSDLHGVAYGNGMFVAVGQYAPTLTSPDGFQWNPHPDANAGMCDLWGITYGEGGFVAVGDQWQQLSSGNTGYGPILVSVDGANWNFQSLGYSLSGVTFGDNLFVAAGNSGIWTSPDAGQWTYQSSGSGGSGIAFGGGTFVAAGGNGTLSSSPDGTNWTSRTSGTDWNLNGVAYGDGGFVVAGHSGTILQSDSVAGSSTGIIGLIGNLNFGAVTVGSGAQRTLVITNSGNLVLTVSDIDFPAGVSGDWLSGTIPPGGFQNVTVTFAPNAAVAYFGYLTVHSDAGSGEDSMAVSGNGMTSTSAWAPLGPVQVTGEDSLGSSVFPNGYLVSSASGRVVGIAPNPTNADVIYIATAGGGVWKTTDGGGHWTPLTDSQITTEMGAIAVAPSDPDVIYAGTGEQTGDYIPSRGLGLFFFGRGILKSTDGGASWVLEGQSLFNRHTTTRIVVDPTDPNVVYAAIAPGEICGLSGHAGIWKSTDGGTNWTDTTAAISTNDVYSDLVMNPSNPQILYAAVSSPMGAPANGVYESLNGGASWSRAGNFPAGVSLGNIKLALCASSPQVLYASIAAPTVLTNVFNFQNFPVCAGLYKMLKTTDGGSTWTELTNTPNYLITQGHFTSTLAVDPSDANVVYAGGTALGYGQPSGLIQSVDGGNTWYAIDGGYDGFGVHGDCHAMAFDGDGRLLLGDDGGIWRLEDPINILWSSLNSDLNTLQFDGFALDPNDPGILYGGTQDNGTVKSSGAGTWVNILAGDGGFVRVDPSQPDTVYTEQFGLNCQRSDDGGTTWAAKLTGISNDNSYFYVPYVLDPSNPSRLVLGTDRIYETANRGENWFALSAPFAAGWNTNEVVTAVAVSPADTNTIYAAAGGAIFATFDHGNSWQERDIDGTPGEWIQSLLVDPSSNLVAYATRVSIGDGQVFYTSDGGMNWTNISSNLPDLPAFCLALDPRTTPHTLYVGNYDGAYVSQDLGGHWSRVASGLPNAVVTGLELNTNLNVLAAATYGRGVWEIGLNSIATAPLLTATRGNNRTVTLAWPGSATGFLLETTPSLSLPHWTAVTNVPATVNGQFQISLPATNASMFFQLKQQ